MGDDHGRKRGLFTAPVVATVVASALSLATNLISALFADDWLKANAWWLWPMTGALVIATIALVILEVRRSAEQARQDAEDGRKSVVHDLPHVPKDVAGSRLPSALLMADRCVCDFRGRQAELKELKKWCTSPDSPSFFILTGASLVGKTRLTIQLSEYVAETWRVGRLLPSAGVGAVDRICFHFPIA